MLTPWEKSYDQSREHIIKQRCYFANKGPSNQGYGFSSSHLWMRELDYKESWALKNWCFWTLMLEKTLESSLDCKEIQPVHPKGNQSWIFIVRTNVEAETSIFGHLIQRADSFEKTMLLGGIGGRRRREQQRMRWLDGITTQWMWFWASFGSWWGTGTGKPNVLQPMGLQSWTQLSDWTELNKHINRCSTSRIIREM